MVIAQFPSGVRVISLRAAALKYGVKAMTLSGWVKRGRVKLLFRPAGPGHPMLLDEDSVAAMSARYLLHPGPGRRTDLPGKSLAPAH